MLSFLTVCGRNIPGVAYRTWASLAALPAAAQDWEWLIGVPRGAERQLPDEVLSDPRVRTFAPLVSDWDTLNFLGQHARQDRLMEVGLGDIVCEGITQVRNVGAEDPVIVYGDYVPADISASSSLRFGGGWETRPFRRSGKDFDAIVQKRATPRSLCDREQYPYHPRIWTRRSWGMRQNASSEWQALILAYIAGVELRHLPVCCYIATQTQLDAAELQVQEQLQSRMIERYALPLLTKWTDDSNLRLIELGTTGAGTHDRINPLRGRTPERPFGELEDIPNDTLGAVLIPGLLPYLPGALVPGLLAECHRGLVADGWLSCVVPAAPTPSAFANPLYQSFWAETTFETLTTGFRQVGWSKQLFDILQCRRVVTENGGVETLHVDLVAIK